MSFDTDATYFLEKQKLHPVWLWPFSIIVIGYFGYLNYMQFVAGTPAGTDPPSDNGLIVLTVLMIALVIFLLAITLKTAVKGDGFYFKFSPIHQRYRHIKWNEIEQFTVKQFHPIRDHFGWGIRWSIKDKGWAYTVKGNKGLHLILKSDKRIIVGTQRPDELQQAIEKAMRK